MKWFGKHIDPKCEYCTFGRVSSDGEKVLCKKRGVVDLWHKCRHFRYDPLKRVPRVLPPLEKHEKEEFEL